METNSTPFPGKSQSLKSKPSRKIVEDAKSNPKNGPPVRKSRVFGASQNPNIPLKPAAQKPKPKPSPRLPENPPKPALTKESPGEKKTKPKKKSVCFQEKGVGKNGNVIEPRMPVKPPSSQTPVKPRLSATPYRSAKECSKCRFDKLETSAYWLGQIKLAESAGKQFCSAEFFRLALECNAEPLRNIKVELKKYLTRHKDLKDEEHWKNLMISYGIVKQDASASSEKGKAAVIEEAAAVDQGQEEQEHSEQDDEKENVEANGSSI